jgi:hypothetical protein
MSVTAGTVLTTTRTLLNDDAAVNWTDASLFPKLTQAHNELQIKLRRAAAPVMKNAYTEQLAAGATGFATPPADLVAPIQLFETVNNGSIASYTLMTEVDNITTIIPAGPSIVYWSWIEESIIFAVPAITVIRQVLMRYWRTIPIPTTNSQSIGFINGELYLAPRIAALAAGSVGQAAEMTALTSLADASIQEVILSNRGRAPQVLGGSAKP